MDPLDIISQFYPRDSNLYNILVEHSRKVAEKSLWIADQVKELEPDRKFIEKAAMLHDIGIFLTRSEAIGCNGKKPYVCHGYLGRDLLDKLGLPKEYGLVCERHTGAGITKKNIIENNLPVPRREMVPVSLEEKIICVADKYFSKSPPNNNKAKTTKKIISNLKKIDTGHAQRFENWISEFGILD